MRCFGCARSRFEKIKTNKIKIDLLLKAAQAERFNVDFSNEYLVLC